MCRKAAYIERSHIAFEGNCALAPATYDYSHREAPIYTNVLLPEGVDENFRIPEVLWNAAERAEKKINSQVGIEKVIALPDDKEITVEDRIKLLETYVQKELVDKGLAAQVAIHQPEVGQSHNWHAHVLATTRTFSEDGKSLHTHKPRELLQELSHQNWGAKWTEFQNDYFRSLGLALRVDDKGLIPQRHLGPVRLRGKGFALLEDHTRRIELNGLAASDPKNILDFITSRQSVFTKEEVEHFMVKHVPGDKIEEVREGFWKLEELVQLRCSKTKEWTTDYSSQTVLEEEQKILRIADRIQERAPKPIPEKFHNSQGLSEEQRKAYHNILNGKGIHCIQGYAGTGKSYLLKALKDTYENRGFVVRGFGPDNATAKVLHEKGFTHTENIYRFLFGANYGQKSFDKGREVWILDEAGKLSNQPLLEFLKLAESKGAKVIFSGDAAQLSSVERGGVFKDFCKRYGSEVLEDIQRQKDQDARSMARDLAQGNIGFALDKLNAQGGIHWSLTKGDAIEALATQWAKDHKEKTLSADGSLIIAGTRQEVRALNEMVRLVRQGRGEVGQESIPCETAEGTIYVSTGDRIEFSTNDRALKIENRMVGVLLKGNESELSVAIQENGKKTRIVTFNPKTFHGFQLGYASTCSRAQGRTVKNAYFLHSSYLNKQMAYVGLTRHINNAKYFVSKEEAFCLSDLKRQALKDASKKTTIGYTHSLEIKKEQAREKRALELEKLKGADAFSKRVKGGVLSLWDRLQEKTHSQIEKHQDRKLSPEFFDVKKEESPLAPIGKGLDATKDHGSEVKNVSVAEQIKPGEFAQNLLKEEVSTEPPEPASLALEEKPPLDLSLRS